MRSFFVALTVMVLPSFSYAADKCHEVVTKELQREKVGSYNKPSKALSRNEIPLDAKKYQSDLNVIRTNNEKSYLKYKQSLHPTSLKITGGKEYIKARRNFENAHRSYQDTAEYKQAAAQEKDLIEKNGINEFRAILIGEKIPFNSVVEFGDKGSKLEAIKSDGRIIAYQVWLHDKTYRRVFLEPDCKIKKVAEINKTPGSTDFQEYSANSCHDKDTVKKLALNVKGDGSDFVKLRCEEQGGELTNDYCVCKDGEKKGKNFSPWSESCDPGGHRRPEGFSNQDMLMKFLASRGSYARNPTSEIIPKIERICQDYKGLMSPQSGTLPTVEQLKSDNIPATTGPR